MSRRKKAETKAPANIVALQASIVQQALQHSPVLAGPMEVALKDTIERLTPLVAEALARLSVEDPDAFLKHYANLAEFKMPKLARVEHTVEGAVDHRHFVAVEHRETGPKAIEGTATVVETRDE